MIKYITLFLSFSIIGIAFGFFLNCAQQGPATGPGGSGSQGEGFSPNTFNRGDTGGEGFEPNQGTHYSSAGNSPRGGNNNNDPFYKSRSVEENERSWGTSAPIGVVSNDDIDQEVFEDFRLGADINTMDDIVDLRVYVKLKKTGSGLKHVHHYNFYGGVVTIGYYDYQTNKPIRVRLRSGTGNDAQYNLWLKGTGGTITHPKKFHGFFQESDSAVILVIDKETPLARNPESNAVNTLYGGSIWIMAFKTIFPASKNNGNSCATRDGAYIRDYNQSGKGTLRFPKNKCWFISKGPFDCRAWREGKQVNTFKALEPDNDCWTKLGDFSGLNVVKAFGVKNLGDL